MPSKDIIDSIGNTPLVEIQRLSPKDGVRLYAKLEGQNPTGSLKDRIAKYMIEKAEAEGSLTKQHVILEPTSGNTGISLAMIARRKGYRITAVMPESVSVERRQLLELYGAEIVLSDGQKGTNGSIELATKLAADEKYFMPYQYGNEANPLAHYETTAMEILAELPDVDTFVAGLGTGGTLMGIGRRLRELKRDAKIIAVVPHPDDVIQGLRSLDEGFIPPILDLSLLHSRIMVKSQDAFWGTRELMEREGIFAGISSGSVIYAAMKVAQRMDHGNVVCLLADGGWKYLSTGLWTHDYEALKPDVEGRIWW